MKEITTALLEKYISDTATAAEQQQVETWLSDNNINRGQLEQLLHLPDGVKMMMRNDPEAAWQKARLAITVPARKQVLFTSTWMRVAAAVALLIGITSVFYLFNSGKPTSHVIVNNTKENKIISMPDSSRIVLHAGSEITYDDTYNNYRNLTMKGRAFFEVTRDPDHPFKVSVAQSVVQVLGTSFNISDDSTDLSVTVATGKVSVETPAHEFVYLEKGEMVSYNKHQQTITKQSNDNPNYDSWKTRVLKFDNTPLPQVLTTLAEYFDVEIAFDKNKAAAITYTSYFSDPKLGDVIQEMREVLDLDFEESGKQIIVTIP